MADYEGRPGANEHSPYYGRYIARVPAGGLVSLLERQMQETRGLLEPLSDAQADHAYAPGKWTIKEVIGHLADSERIFSYRALRFGRGDATELAGFDQDPYVPAGAFGARMLVSLVEELTAVRQATVRLLAGLPAEAWLRRGVASGHVVSVRALACIIAGHELHHRSILETRYLARSLAGG